MMDDTNIPPVAPGPVFEPEPSAETPFAQPSPVAMTADTPQVSQPEPAPASKGTFRIGCIAAIVALIVATLFGMAAGFAGARLALISDDDQIGTISVIEGNTDEPVAAVAAKSLPSVVNIDVTATRATSMGDESLPDAHPNVPVIGNGSGVAYKADPEGGTFIVTNDHVVADATRITVTDVTGESYDGEVVGTDPNTDVAVVWVDADIQAIEVGDSEDLLVGDLVVAIGSPFGLQQSVTSGVVSAIGRSIPDSSSSNSTYPLVDVVQTDAAINPGNSGGALCDREGLLVGINTAIFSDSGVNEGIGFAIPVRTVTRVADEIIESGEARYPFLGIVGQTVTEQLAEAESLDIDEGALVVSVTEGTGAAEAGVSADDVITGYNGEPIRSMDDLILAVRRSSIGDTVTLEIHRDGEDIEIDITVGDKPEDLQTMMPDETDPETDAPEEDSE